MRRRGPRLREIVREVNVSDIETVVRPFYKKWSADDGKPGRPPHNPVGLVLALLIKLLRGWSDDDIVAFLRKHPEWLGFLGLDRGVPCDTIWSKLVERVPEAALDELLARIAKHLVRQGLLWPNTLLADGSFLAACNDDPDATWGYVRRLDKRRALPAGLFLESGKKILGYGYRLHVLAEGKHGLPLAVHVTKANVNDADAWPDLYQASRAGVDWAKTAWFTADKGYDTTGVRKTLRPWSLDAVIPAANTPKGVKAGGFTGRRARVYKKRTGVERYFALFKSFFSLIDRRITGFDRVRKWVKLAAIATLLMAWANHQAGDPVRSVKGFRRRLR